MKILIFNWKDLAHPLAGGAEVYTERSARELVRRGHDVTIFCSRVEGRPSSEIVEGVRVVRRGSRLSVYREARHFWKATTPGEFDIVVDEINTRPFLTPRYVRTVPIVALMHQLAREIWRYETPLPVALAGRYYFERHWLRDYRDIKVLTDGPSSAASFVPYGLHDAVPVPMGADGSTVHRSQKADRPTVVFLGRLIAAKRPDDAIEAFGVLRREVPDAQMWVMGDGPLLDRLRRDSPEGVELLGFVSHEERMKRLAAAHVLVATSVREGWGLNVSEAAAHGTPSIGYDVAGLADSVPLSGGLLVEPTPTALGQGLIGFFRGDIELEPRISTSEWVDVAAVIEAELSDSIERFSALSRR
ncbi:MAG: glycosyltransferase family 4 protein [Ilumatobacteraceae bacterium]